MHQPLTPSRSAQREQVMPFGTRLSSDGVVFRLWAPDAAAVSVKILDLGLTMNMNRGPGDWNEAEVSTARPGMRYSFVLDDGTEVPDPASRYQPEDVDGPSEIVDPLAFEWSDTAWRGRPWEETILYELHIGTFTREGTFRAAIDRLDHLVDLGVTAIELLPVADFAGQWNWGYDGALLFAPDASYGRPEDLKALVNAAHDRGLSVFLDVVYNHFGPKGNHMQIYTPLMTDKHHTPWGPAVNYDDIGSETVRDFVFQNACFWINEYHFDGLRFDAVHEIADDSPRHMLQDLAERVRAATHNEHLHLIVENSDNQAGWLKRHENGSPWLYDAQWDDDVHHGLHAGLTGESHWYYADFTGRMDLIGRALAEGFSWQGEHLKHEDRIKGESSAFLPATAFVSYAQNHDQVGNRPFGERLTHLVEPRIARLWAAIYLLSPQIPMLFMGEEWGSERPFLFFSDVGEDLADLIRQGRSEELKKFPKTLTLGTPPDPMARETFEACKLDWETATGGEHARFLSLYKRLIGLRKAHVIPRLAGMAGYSGRYELLGPRVLRVSWTLGDGSTLTMTANLSPEPFDGINVWGSDHLWLEGFASGETLEGWSVVYSLSALAQG